MISLVQLQTNLQLILELNLDKFAFKTTSMIVTAGLIVIHSPLWLCMHNVIRMYWLSNQIIAVCTLEIGSTKSINWSKLQLVSTSDEAMGYCILYFRFCLMCDEILVWKLNHCAASSIKGSFLLYVFEKNNIKFCVDESFFLIWMFSKQLSPNGLF